MFIYVKYYALKMQDHSFLLFTVVPQSMGTGSMTPSHESMVLKSLLQNSIIFTYNLWHILLYILNHLSNTYINNTQYIVNTR